jgi:C-terminal processing protease CtpA/Prc
MNKEYENLSRNDEQVRVILGSLEKIDAPKTFDFQLKSKIAERKSSVGNWAFWKYFAVGVPTLACIALFAFFAFNHNEPTEIVTAEQPKIVNQEAPEINRVVVNQVLEEPAIPVAETTIIKKSLPVVEPKIVDEKIYANIEKPQNITPKTKKVVPKKRVVNEIFSNDSAVTNINKPLQPKGLNGSNAANMKINESDTVFEIESLLNDLGIETANENGRLKVKSVTKNSSAERSGIKNNDLIDAIDNQKIAPKETRKRSFDAKSINITRDGKTMELKLQQ